MEGGWQVAELGRAIDPNTQQPLDVARVSAQAGDQIMEKWVRVSDLRDWNTPDIEDTAPKAWYEGLATPETQADQETAHAIGEVAVEESGLVEAMEPVADTQADDTFDDEDMTVDMEYPEEQPASLAEEGRSDQQEQGELTYSQQVAMAELSEQWGLSPEVTVEAAVTSLRNEREKIKAALDYLTEFDPVSQSVAVGLKKTDRGSGTTYVAHADKEAFDRFLDGPGFRKLTELTGGKTHLLPKSLRSELGQYQNQLRLLNQRTKAMTIVYKKTNPQLDMEQGRLVRKALETQLPALSEKLADSDRSLVDMLSRLGVTVQDEAPTETAAENEMPVRNEQVKAWADELAGGVSPERLAELTRQIENAVAIESRMQDDPNSPYQWFGDRVRGNVGKQRNEALRNGRQVATIPSHLYVAELMTDLLTGKFDVVRGNREIIQLNAKQDGGVAKGQHRVAALAMLFGNNQWMKAAQERGIKYTYER